MRKNLLENGFHDSEIYGIKVNNELKKLELFIKLADESSIVLSLIDAQYYEFDCFSLQNSVYEILSFCKDEIPDFIFNDHPALVGFKNLDYYNDYKVAYINPSVGLTGVILFKDFEVLQD